MKSQEVCFGLGIAAAIFTASPARSGEFGYIGVMQIPGITLGGATGAAPPPGVYGFLQAGQFVGHFVGPGAPSIGGSPTEVRLSGGAPGLVYVPGWTVLGATYDAVLVTPWLGNRRRPLQCAASRIL